MTIFQEISKYRHDKTNLNFSLNYEEAKKGFVEGNFDIVLDGVKQGWIEFKFYEDKSTMYVSHLYLGSEFSNKNFTKDLADWGSELMKENSISYISADAFYAAEKIVKDKGWKENNINQIGKYIYEVENG
jgi:hypothetical protein